MRYALSLDPTPRGFSRGVGRALGRSTRWLVLLSLVAGAAHAQLYIAPGFQRTLVWGGFENPTLIRFAPDGRVFVGEYGGRIYVLDGVSDTSPTLFADLSVNVFSGWDRGLLGLAIHPDFPTTPYVYALYAYDAPPGEVAPYWNDVCPDPPGFNHDGCLVTGRLTRLTMGPSGVMEGPEVVLIGSNGSASNPSGDQWCQQYPSHSTGDLAFGADGMLYVTGGDGASFTFADYGQGGGSPGSETPPNPCGDPPTGVGGTQTTPTAQGGALRSQDLNRAGDPVTYDGTVLRVDPLTGAAAPGNPLIGGSDTVDDRVIAYGLRNPFRIKFQPGTNRLFVGDVGWGLWEEIDVVEDPADGVVENFGWPCFEGGNGTQLEQTAYGILSMCAELVADGGSTAPGTAAPSLYAYHHQASVVPNGPCGTGGSNIGGIAFNDGSAFPPQYAGALFFQDSTRKCMWAMLADGAGRPDPTAVQSFWVDFSYRPVDLTFGPDDKLYFADFDGGGIHRIAYFASNTPPQAVLSAQPTSGAAPLFVQFDASASSDPDGDAISFAWDLDGDGAFDDSTAAAPSSTYTAAGSTLVRVRVTDDGSPQAADVASVTIVVDNTPPTATILAPSPPPQFAVGDAIAFSGEANDAEDGLLPAGSLDWKLDQLHCAYEDPSDCHAHTVQSWTGVASGSFSAPDHGYPSYLVLTLTATDFGVGGSGVLSDSVSLEIHPATVPVSVDSDPTALQFTLGEITETTPAVVDVIENTQTTIATPSPQTVGGTDYTFSSWSDGGGQSHGINPQGPVDLFATFVAPVCNDGVREGAEECDGADLGGAACADLGCAGGVPSCTASCTLDYGTCIDCPVCDGDGVCELDEDCGGCPSDCASSPGAACGDGVCNAGDGEDCVSCPTDCNGQQSGKHTDRFCCGDGDGVNPLGCGDAACRTGGWTCLDAPAPTTCCGDLVCDGAELGGGCAIDCAPANACGDGVCNGSETPCTCAADCGAPTPSELACADGVDDDCDGLVDCADADCAGDAACVCAARGDACASDAECCSQKCRGPQGARSCK